MYIASAENKMYKSQILVFYYTYTSIQIGYQTEKN